MALAVGKRKGWWGGTKGGLGCDSTATMSCSLGSIKKCFTTNTLLRLSVVLGIN